MTAIAQERLRDELEARLRSLGAAEGARDLTAFVVVRQVDVARYVAGAIQFAADLKPTLADSWLEAFTRTVFLAGDPLRIAARYPARQLAADGSAGWFGPADGDSLRGLRLLLRSFEAPVLPPLPDRVLLGDHSAAGGRQLYVDTAGIGMADYLIHLNHLVCEATIAGLLVPDMQLELRHVERIGDSTGPFACTRVAVEGDGKERLRRYAALSAEGLPR